MRRGVARNAQGDHRETVNLGGDHLGIPAPVGEDVPPSHMISTGHILGGRYRLMNQLGEGGMGTVWRAEHVTLGSQFAVKLIHDDLAESSVVRARFRREAQAAAALGGDHVVRTIDYGVEGETPYIVMELLTGESLQQRLAREGRLAPEAVSGILSQVAVALDKAHDQGLIHRDLKPGNLYITRADDGHECIKLLDFGTAKLLRRNEESDFAQTRTGAMVGSPAYMCPEQLRGLREVGPGVDIWALGVVVYECLLGQRPFQAPTLAGLAVRICSDPLPVPSTVGPVPSGFDEWFAQACARDPLQRFQRAHELAQTFQRTLATCPKPLDAEANRPSSSLGKPAEQKDSPPPHEESTPGIARSQSETTKPMNRSGLGWVFGASAGIVAFGLLTFVIVRAAGPVGGVAETSRAVSQRRDAGLPTVSAVVSDAGTTKDLRTSSTDLLVPAQPNLRKTPARPSRRPRNLENATDQVPPAPAGQTDGVYGF